MIKLLAAAIVAGAILVLASTLKRTATEMSDVLNRLTASVDALVSGVSANNTELGSIASELRSHATANDDTALAALADRIDAATSSLAEANTAAADALSAHSTSTGNDVIVGNDTLAGGGGGDSIPGDAGGDTIAGGAGGDSIG